MLRWILCSGKIQCQPTPNREMGAMPHSYHHGFESSAVTAGLMAAALVYVCGWLRIRRFERSAVGTCRILSYTLGLFLTWMAIGSPFAGLDHKLLTAHMIKHLLLMTIAPPLVFLGHPSMTLWHGLPRRIRRALDYVFHSSSAQQFARALTHPAVCWLGAAGALVVWHVPHVFTYGLRSGIWHGIEQASFLGTGLLFWWPVVHPPSIAAKWSQWSILLYLFLATLPCDILSGFLVFCDRVVYPVFLSSPHSFGFSPMEDQQCAGALMWTCVTVVYMVAGTLITVRLLSRQRSLEYPLRQSVPFGTDYNSAAR